MSSRMLRRLDPSSDLELLAEVAQLLTQFDMQRVLGRVIRLIANAVGASRAHLFLHPNYELDWRNIFQTDRLDPDTIFTASVGGLDSGLPGLAVEERSGILVRDVMMDDRRYVFGSELRDAQSALAVPLICNQDLMAVLLLLHPKPEHFTDNHFRLVQIAMNQASVAVHNARLENHVRSGRHQFQAVLHAVNNPMLVLNREGQVQMMNAAAERYFAAAEIRPKLGRKLVETVQDDTAFNRIIDIIATPPSGEDHWLFKAHSEQRNLHFDVLMSVWENPMQGESGFVVMMHDVTTLIELDRFKNDMLRMASHDLRSPLALITGYCDVIEMDLPPDMPQLLGYLEAVRRTTTRVDNLLTDLLRIERIQSSPLELYQPINVEAMLATIIENSLPGANQKQQQLLMDFHDLPEQIVADPIMIREAMENFVSNAVKYTPDAGQIIVRAFARGTAFYFVVEDNGVGIGEEHLPKLFTSFYRAKQAGTEHIDGTGVGLSLVKTVVERHQGKVWVESQVGIGSQFGFWLPLSS
ncbi:MAG: GAF domain-containing protein [Anaerolineae bacterium]|nr:GAF domain-containing protein [Anaerolineae bacterium]